jgi:predicted nucleic-acid-binding Zn-ribbon protein
MFGFGAKAKCAKCGSTSFRLKPIELIDSEFPYNAVFCNKCGAPFAVIEDINVGAVLGMQKRQIAALGSKIDSMARKMDEIAEAIKNRAASSDQYR